MTASWAGKMEDPRQAWGGHCIWCGTEGYDKNRLEFCHLPGKPTNMSGSSRGLSRRYYDVKRNPSNYVLLCMNHHIELDKRGGGKK